MTIQTLYDLIEGDYQFAKSRLMMDSFISKFVIKFLDDKSYQTIHESYLDGDEKGIFEGAHALKGVSGNLGFTVLNKYSSIICEEFRAGSVRTMTNQELEQIFLELDRAYETTINTIKQFQAEQ